MARRHADDLVFYATLGIILGGRLGYVLFYKPGRYFHDPVEIVQLWDGGMSFHGGVIGVSLGILYLAWRHKLDLAAHPRLCRLLRPVRPVPRPARQFRERRALGRADRPCPGACVFPDAAATVAAPPEPALRGGARGRAALPRPAGCCSGRRSARYQPASWSASSCSATASAASCVEFFREPDAQLIAVRRRRPISTWASGCRCR